MIALPPSERYAHALYYALGALTGYGGIGQPRSPAEILFAATTIVIGFALFASIVGGISEALGSGQSETTRFLESIEAVDELMKQEDLPVHLRQRIDAVFEHEYDKLLANERAPHWNDLAEALNVLPRYLRDEVVGQIAIDTIHLVPLFQAVDKTVCAHLARCLKAEFVLNGDILFHQDELGRCMHFVRSGTLDVIVRGLGKVASLGAGDYVGEMSILFEEPRTATVRATSDCELLLLEKVALYRELGAFPDVLADMKATATERKLYDMKETPAGVANMPRRRSNRLLAQRR
jgi:voltage-gated potassium channel